MDFVKGAGELKKRLGFNPFKITKTDGTEYFMLFNDSEPMHFSCYDSKEVRHNFYDAANEFYKATGTKTLLTTAGWEKSNDNAQKAAESFVKNPDCLENLNISIHPFHAYMARSNKYKQQGNPEKAKYWRDKYVEMMANVIKTTYPLKDKINRYFLVIESYNSISKDDYNADEARELMNDIMLKLEKDGIMLDDYFLHHHSLYHKPMQIGLIGRGQSIIDENINDRDYPVYRNKSFVRPKEQLKEIYNYLSSEGVFFATKIINTDGSIIIKQEEPCVLDMDYAKLPLKLNFKHPTNWRSNYEYADIPEGKMPKTGQIICIANELW